MATDPAWYLDPRWWGIIASASLGAFSVGAQAVYRWRDQQRKRREEEFDEDIGGPIRESFSSLRNLRAQIQVACQLPLGPQRDEAIKKVREEQADEALSPFSSAVALADGRLANGGYFTQKAYEFEDKFHTNLSLAQSSASMDERARAKVALLKGIDELLAEVTRDLRIARNKFDPS